MFGVMFQKLDLYYSLQRNILNKGTVSWCQNVWDSDTRTRQDPHSWLPPAVDINTCRNYRYSNIPTIVKFIHCIGRNMIWF